MTNDLSASQKSIITEQQYRAEVLRTYAGPADFQSKLTLAALGLAGETGEVVDQVKKMLFQSHSLDSQHFKKELGDVFWYFTLALEACGFTLAEVMSCNVEKLRRRYPDGFDPERSLHRSEDE